MTAPGRVVLVVGPRLAGVDGVIAAVRTHLPGVAVVGAEGFAREGAPDAVLAVVSAVAPVTESDWAPIAAAAARTDLMIGVVSKIDAHRGWRDVMEADRMLVAAGDTRRDSMPWVGVAAAPDLGEPCLGELVAVLRERLADPGLNRRNQWRSNEFRLQSERARARSATASRADALASRIVAQRTRLELLRCVRDRCSELRAELRDVAAAVPVGGSSDFEALVKAEAERAMVELDEDIASAVGAAATELGLDDHVGNALESGRRQDHPVVSRSPSSSRRLEGRLMTVLGVGFGLGIALASSRLLAGLAPSLSVAGLAAGAVAGLALVVWVVRVRGLLHDRALLDRWVTEVAANVRWHGEATVAERLLLAESQWAKARPREPSRRAPDSASVDAKKIGRDVTDQYEW